MDDSDIDVELALRVLKQGRLQAEWQRVDREDALRRALAQSQPDVILSDFSMPLFDGARALRVVHEVAPRVPFIFLSGTIGGDRAAEAMRLGAAAYVEKGDAPRLLAVLMRVLDARDAPQG